MTVKIDFCISRQTLDQYWLTLVFTQCTDAEIFLEQQAIWKSIFCDSSIQTQDLSDPSQPRYHLTTTAAIFGLLILSH